MMSLPRVIARTALLLGSVACSNRAQVVPTDAEAVPSASTTPRPTSEPPSMPSAQPAPTPLPQVSMAEPQGNRPPEPCIPAPQGWLGDWGLRPGLVVSCGGVTGACSVRRTKGETLWRFRAPNLLSEGASAPFAPVCIRAGMTVFGAGHLVDRWPNDAVLFSEDSMSHQTNGFDGGGVTAERLAATAKSSAVPSWAVGDFVDEGREFFIRVGENAVWVMQAAPEAPANRRVPFVKGRVKVASGSCVDLAESTRNGVPEGELCLVNPPDRVELRLRRSTPDWKPATRLRRSAWRGPELALPGSPPGPSVVNGEGR